MILSYDCSKMMFLLNIVVYIFKVIQWVIPIFLIVLVIIDFAKAMIGGDEKKSKEALSTAGKRLIYAIILFLVYPLVKMIFNELDNRVGENRYEGATSWISCFNDAMNNVKNR